MLERNIDCCHFLFTTSHALKLCEVDYIIFIMFKPSLKRSKLEEIQLYTKTYHPPHAQHATVKTLKEVAAEYSSFNVE